MNRKMISLLIAIVSNHGSIIYRYASFIMKNIIGVVMCGGESKRMGSDKGLMPVQNTIQAKFMADKISFLQVPVVFSINKYQLKSYSGYIAFEDLIVDENELRGPVRGLLSVHTKFPSGDILLIACDMAELDADTIKNLLLAYSKEDIYDFYVYQDEMYAQPFCGIYTAKGMDKLAGRILSQSLTNISLQNVLNNGVTKRIAINNKNAFTNLNYKR